MTEGAVFICHLYLPHRLCFLHLFLTLSPEHRPSSVGKADGLDALSVFVKQQLGAERGNPCIKSSKIFFEAKAFLKIKMVQELFSGSETKWNGTPHVQMAAFSYALE